MDIVFIPYSAWQQTMRYYTGDSLVRSEQESWLIERLIRYRVTPIYHSEDKTYFTARGEPYKGSLQLCRGYEVAMPCRQMARWFKLTWG